MSAKKKKADVASGPRDAGLGEKVQRYLKAREAGKRGYKRADRLIKEIAAAVKPGQEIVLNESGRKVVLVDKFAAAKDDIVWTPCAARRWDLEIIEP